MKESKRDVIKKSRLKDIGRRGEEKMIRREVRRGEETQGKGL